ncbi:hypothetical protein [Ferruginibacter sp. SUN106]|uniref:hypothetical protein n=1 Tax=Ferruginibacter sp. SUN106 TaxID=2978348 RepID=UPI003D3616BB
MKLFFTSLEQNLITAAPVTVAYRNLYNAEAQLVQDMLQENLQHDQEFKTKLSGEIFNFLQFTASMLCAFPVGLYMRKRIRKNKRLNYILQFKELLQVRNNIEKGSFAYDTLLFKQSPVQLLKNKSHLANLVCLAILFGDEFIDGIAAEHGKENIQRILYNEDLDYYLRYKKINNRHELYYEFDICEVLPDQVLESSNSKYGITYKAFYNHLQFLLQEMNSYLNKLDDEKATEAAQLICKACNKCFDTYKADINEFDGNYTLTNLLQYQKTKDDDIIQVLLTLRAVLLNKKQLQYQKQFSSWSSMVRSMQLYDDMEDVAGDCDFQMNVLCFFAKNYFTEEWLWLQQHKERLQKCKGIELHSTISVYMPASCMMAMQYARNIAHTKLSWVQRKIQNYLWRKNWLGFNNPLLNKNGFCLSAVMNKKDNSIPLKLYFIHKQVMYGGYTFITADMKWAYIIDVALMDSELKTFLLKKLSRKERYFLTSCYLEFPIAKKAAIAKKILTGNNVNPVS